MKKVRCAIYTRKSSEEGLEQDFNSLHAQREACAAYILSQASEGWTLHPNEYDDGGLSGGTLERPALQRLMKDIEAGRIDIVVVYKVDRLSRSLLDFAKLVEAFDKANVSFVSVTQSFNTTNSMGRLTLNMLLSFAQFEREVTAERIRDKIAASKARGMWMGGNPPLGYKPDGRTLAIVEEHAEIVRHIFARYLDLGNVRLVVGELAREGIIAPERIATTGRARGGRPFTRGQIYKLLSNPIYIGEIHHKGQVHAGKHEAIIDRATWGGVQRMLVANLQGERSGSRAQSPSLLAGRIFDQHGEPLVAVHANKKQVRYRYYVSRSLQHDADRYATDGMRIPAREIEAAVITSLAGMLDDPLALLAQAGIALDSDRLRMILKKAEQLAASVRRKQRDVISDLVGKVVVHTHEIVIRLSVTALCRACTINPASDGTISLTAPVRLRRTGLALRLVQRDGRPVSQGKPDPGLIALLRKARNWWQQLQTGTIDIATIAHEEKVNDSWVSRIVRLNFLAPAIVEAILAGTQPTSVSATSLRTASLPINWDEQMAMFGM
ncbi:recombinase family protein [Sphingomonas fennica]|uniref:Recombinase family protein n=1 Tax=Edaphosphingomonas fennica TaxID=114404 RepID=A0A2T4HPS5_9SPHN|nr:recombinase family protein [Sphingomonas fennica]PTD17801.1 recombinase family protein [Sphingomonas fennica]